MQIPYTRFLDDQSTSPDNKPGELIHAHKIHNSLPRRPSI